MALTRDQVEHVARLARIHLSSAEAEELTGQLSRILDHMAVLERLDTTGVEPTYHAVALQNVLREDKPHASLDKSKALNQAPDAASGCFKVPKITEG